jgi:ribosomal protein L30E
MQGNKELEQKLKFMRKGDSSRIILDENIDPKIRKKVTYAQTRQSRNIQNSE